MNRRIETKKRPADVPARLRCLTSCAVTRPLKLLPEVGCF